MVFFFFFFSSRRRHTRSLRDWSSDVCSSDLLAGQALVGDDGGARGRAVGWLVVEHLPGLLALAEQLGVGQAEAGDGAVAGADDQDRKSTRLNSSHVEISYAVF